MTLLGQLLGFRLDHQHRGLRAGDDQVHLRLGHLRLGRVQHVLAADVADARRADRAVERDAGDRQRRARADQRRDVGGDLGVERQHVDDDLHLVVEAFGEERPQRPVDQARGQRLELARAAFTLEEAARDLAGGVGLLDVVDGQREEVLARLGVLLGDDGGEDDGVLDRDDDGAARLASDLAGLQRDGLLAPLERLGDLVEDAHVLLLRFVTGAIRAAPTPGIRGLAQCHSKAARRSMANIGGMTRRRRLAAAFPHAREPPVVSSRLRATVIAYLRRPSFWISAV